MNYQRPELRRLLAAEYVLGTLHGKARKRFEHLLMHNKLLQREVTAWEAKLSPLAELEPVQPSKKVWKNIAAEISAQETPPRKLKQGLRWWRGLSIVTTTVAILLSVFLLIPSKDIAFEPNYLAVIADEKTEPVWLLKADTTNGWLQVEALKVPTLTSNNDYELWLLPAANGAPISLGLLPETGKRRIKLATAEQLPTAAGIAVSLEPTGGSTTGAPSGPVLYQGRIHPANATSSI